MSNDSLMEQIKCDLCGSSKFKVMYRPMKKEFDPEKIFSASGGIMGTQQIVSCEECGLVYVNPRIVHEHVINAYSNAVDDLYVSQAEGRRRTFEKGLILVEKYASNKGKILDIGAAAGFFLHVAKKNGWEVYGVEPSKWMSEWGNKKFNVNIKNGVLKEVSFKDNFFDVVTMWDVLEHTTEPLNELIEVNRILKPGGIVIINFPNIGSKLAKLAGKRWWFFLSVHLYHFSPETLRKMLEKSGFEVVSFRRHYQTLSLEHLVKMVGLYSKGLSNIGLKIVKYIKIGNLQIPYYASQANVIAKKK